MMQVNNYHDATVSEVADALYNATTRRALSLN